MKAKRFLAVMMATIVACSGMSFTVLAAEDDFALLAAQGGTVEDFVGPDGVHTGSNYAWLQESQLHSQDGAVDKGLGDGWLNYTYNNPLGIAINKNADFRAWKIETTGGVTDGAYVWFIDDNDAGASPVGYALNIVSEKAGGGQTYFVAMPDGYRLVGGYCHFTETNGNQVFNAAYGGHNAVKEGTVTVTAEVDAWHNEITPQEYWDRTVDTFYERNVDEFYARTVDEFYERNVDEFYERPVWNFYERDVDEYYERTVEELYERPVTDIYQRYAQKYFVPVFEKKMEGVYDETLVTRLTYSSNGTDAKPVNGGVFKNGHTYVTVDVAEASTAEGIRFTIADSSKNSGKKTPDQYNRPINYTYNVKIADNKLTVTFPESLAYASVGAEVWDKAPKNAKNAPKHYENTVTVDLPANDGTVDLYFHLEKLGWYAIDEEGNPVYQFKEWRYDHTEEGRDWVYVETEYGEYALVNTVYGDWELVDTKYGEYELVKTTYGDYALVDTQYGNYELVDTRYGEYELVDTRYGEYELVDTKYGEYELIGTGSTGKHVKDTYTGTLTLTVDGKAAELNRELTLGLGEHTFVLSGEGFEPVTRTVAIDSGTNGSIVLKAEVRGEDITLDTQVVKADRDATPHYADREAARHEADNAVEKHYTDREAVRHEADGKVNEQFADRTAAVHTADRAPEQKYADGEVSELKKEEFIYRPDIKLGSEDDPDGEYAVKLN